MTYIKKIISNHQLTILLLLYKFRFLNTNQLQKLLKQKDSQQSQLWLKDLTDRYFIFQDYSRKKIEANNKPAIYNLKTKSNKILKDHKECDLILLRRSYKESSLSKNFKERCMFIADIYIHLLTQAGKQATAHFSTSTDLVKFSYFPDPLPDAYVAIKEPKKTRRYFIKLFDAGDPWKKKIKPDVEKYIQYFEDNIWQNHTKSSFPLLLIIAPDDRVKTYLLKFISKTFEERSIDAPFYLATKVQIKAEGIKPSTWERVK